ncbi:MAG: thiol:disulfide interchange protein DsbA/DsbL [Halieaceae bacterium]|nr:thiol:disulfide interchange protein DsbA/DsbL [Halieaceae bacterium]
MFKRLLLSLMLLSPLPSVAEDNGESYVEGVQYDLIVPAIRTANPDKIEVVEFFWYGCGHCYNLEPLLEQWRKELGEDVDFRGSPANWRPQPMELHAKAFYTAEALGVLDTMHTVIFQAMNIDRKRLNSEGEIGALFAANGVPLEQFTRAFNSFGVGSQIRQADARARSARITGTPELMVNGKYRISTGKAGSSADMLKVAKFLIEKERAARGG